MKLSFPIAIAIILAVAARASAQLEAVSTYTGAARPILVRVSADHDAAARVIALYDAPTRRELARAELPAGVGVEIDLRAMFPSILNDAPSAPMYAQYLAGETPIGAPLVLDPMITPRVAINARTAAILAAFEQDDAASIRRLRSMTREQLDAMVLDVVFREPPARVCAGYRVYIDRFVEIETSFGRMTLALRPDAAPITCFSFLHLVEGGFYDSVPFHRIVPTDRLGRPFVVQAGDPTGTGDGGPGYSIDFEPSMLAHDFGVVSMARELDDPNSDGSQFFIALSREGCARLDGRFVAFAEVIDGAAVLDSIAAAPVGPRDPDDPASAADRPLDPPVIIRARTVPATPITERPARITREASAGVER